MKFPAFTILALSAFCGSACASIVAVSGVMTVAFGTAKLSVGGSPVSQTMAVTAETAVGSGVPGDVIGSALAGLGPAIVGQLLADPTVTSVMPGFVLAALPGLESANGLGPGVQGSSFPALLSLLEIQSVSFVVASDTGPQYFPDLSTVYTYAALFGPYASHPGITYEVDVNVNFYRENLQLTATPEPPSLALTAGMLIGIFQFARRRGIR